MMEKRQSKQTTMHIVLERVTRPQEEPQQVLQEVATGGDSSMYLTARDLPVGRDVEVETVTRTSLTRVG